MNHALTQAISSITYPLRFNNLCLPEQEDFFNTFIAPYERFHYYVCSYAPFISSEWCCDFELSKLADWIFDDKNMMFRCNPFEGKFLTC